MACVGLGSFLRTVCEGVGGFEDFFGMDYGRGTEPSVGWQGAAAYGSARTHDEEWERLIDENSGAAYWFNNQTGESVWVEENEASGTDRTLRTGMHEATYASFTGEASPEGVRENPDEVMVDTSSLDDGGDAVKDALSEAKRRKLAAEQELEFLRNAAAAAAEAEDRTVAMVKKDLEKSRAIEGGGSGATVSPELAAYIQSPTEKKLDELKRRQQLEVDEDEDMSFTYVSNSPETQNLDEVFAQAHAEARALIEKVKQDDDNRVKHVTNDVDKALDRIDKALHREKIVDENMKAFNANHHGPLLPKEAPDVEDTVTEETELQTLIDANKHEEERLAKAGKTIVEREDIPMDPESGTESGTESRTESVVVEAVDISENRDTESIDPQSDGKAVVAEWDNRLLQGRDKGPGKGPGSLGKGPGWGKTHAEGLRTPGISSQKYTLRHGEQLSSHPSGEVWDEELQMFYRKRYND